MNLWIDQWEVTKSQLGNQKGKNEVDTTNSDTSNESVDFN